ncbi:hypothetical protein [Pseudonocardia sp. TRM90224]|uniref:hypothetical protein n=1 Tax=Pseudonocardia sp. TRM90224 TaxID=2812678 RepID=UPI001E5471AD|nr:hypothetical protein [Pseudonocardia sp. TRM90224]
MSRIADRILSLFVPNLPAEAAHIYTLENECRTCPVPLHFSLWYRYCYHGKCGPWRNNAECNGC